jgi:hypothetical protein
MNREEIVALIMKNVKETTLLLKKQINPVDQKKVRELEINWKILYRSLMKNLNSEEIKLINLGRVLGELEVIISLLKKGRTLYDYERG